MTPIQKGTLEFHEHTLTGLICDDLAELLTSRQGYVEMQELAGERPWSEMDSWSMIARWYVGSQSLVLERNLKRRPRQIGLAKVITYVGKHAAEIAEMNPGWTHGAAQVRTDLHRASPAHFSLEESERDLEVLNELRQATRSYSLRSGDEWSKLFEKNCRERVDAETEGFMLPAFEDLDLAISAMLDLIVKYAELIMGTPFHAFELGFALTDGGLIEAIANDWRSSGAADSSDLNVDHLDVAAH
jgi:hypothetical protein